MKVNNEMLKNYMYGKVDKEGNVKIKSIEERTGKHNGTLILKVLNKIEAMPEEPGPARIYAAASRLNTIAEILDKPMDELIEADLIRFNKELKDREMKSAKYYRRALKQFLRLTDKKKFIDLIDSDYLRSPKTKNSKEKKLVDPNDFWTIENMTDYIKECKKMGVVK